ncbi:hypothetical protein HBI68_252370 [Parastagonospora nodorum]|nr:hypothetical protein HBI51_252170 [Parastagonospora nodorum]KAH5982976.1 hypothetical protein HBI84_249800 [Parastagonospora nodorum]KAH6133532.1 hypothetical protein HBI68_252370 [Parastagonospora nodorum]KAH6383076.1 hypothetical protein HBI60_258700 [Parastagonospora nodorum]KAH6515400.1 hypothetical protein HBI07_251610 [Parastagonospora nodorum]
MQATQAVPPDARNMTARGCIAVDRIEHDGTKRLTLFPIVNGTDDTSVGTAAQPQGPFLNGQEDEYPTSARR